ncbi:S8 family serine peptidase [Microbacterium tumbae]
MLSTRPRALRDIVRGLTAAALITALSVPLSGSAAPSAVAEETPSPSAPATIAAELLAVGEEASSPGPEASGEGRLADAASTLAAETVDANEDAPAGDPIEIMVMFDDPGIGASAQGDPERAAAFLQETAQSHWDAAEQALDRLEAEGALRVLNRFWITSGVLVSAVPTERTLRLLAELPGASSVVPNFEVEPLESEDPVPLAEPSITATDVTGDGTPVTYGLERIGAPQTWLDFGAEGQGVRVAVLDTGVDVSHPDLAGRMVGSGLGDAAYPGGWISFDRTGSPVASRPSDPGSHGTHVAGTVLGGDASGTQIGVAPQAQLMAANVLSGSGGGSLAKILAGMQWAVQPYDANGDPAGRPADVVNMSLGSSGYDETFIPLVRNLRQAGIFPAIAIGNAPCGPTGTSSPGDIYDAFGVGMTNADDEVDPGSCGAVTSWPTSISERYDWPEGFVKPDASAPGAAVFSAMPGGLWGESTGTSMATPHVAGAVALIRSAQAGLTVDQIEEALESTAWRPDGAAEPDTGYGHGRIDVHAAVAAVLGQAGVNGVVVDAATGKGVAGATVSFDERGETWTTDAQGRFTARLVPGTYVFQATRFGYEPQAGGKVVVTENAFGRVELKMTAITVGSLAGIVVDTQSGAPIANAQIQVVGQPITATTGADGGYRIDGLPLGSYRVSATAEGYRDSVSAPAEIRAALTTTINYRLAALQRVLVLGDNGGRTAALLGANGFVAESVPRLADAADVADYDIVVWDAPQAVPDDELLSFIDEADAAGVGVVWLDQGSSENSGIGQLSRATGDPAGRAAANDRTLTSTGYRVLVDHAIFGGGVVSAESLTVGDVIAQNAVEGGPKYYAWFEGLTGEAVSVLAETVTTRAVEGQEPEIVRAGDGIAVAQRENSRHALLALHGSSPAVDTRTWSLPSTQLFLNAVAWTAPVAAQTTEPEIILPVPPVVQPGEPGGGGTSTPPPADTGSPAETKPASRAPAAQIAPKPKIVPDAPFASAEGLTEANRGGVTVRRDGDVAAVRIPGSEPGEWYFLHVYPSKTPVDWIRVNDDGELRIDIARLAGGSYLFAFTDEEGDFAGWVEIVIEGASPVEATPAPVVVDEGAQPSLPVAAGAFALTVVEQLMLLGAGLLILATAALLLLSSRRRPPVSGAQV